MVLVEQPIIKCDIVNGNNRCYSKEVMQDCISKLNNGAVPVYLGEPNEQTIGLMNCAIGAATNIGINEDGMVTANIVIPDKPGVDDFKKLVDKGVLSFSTASTATVVPTFSSNFDNVHYVIDPTLESLYVTDKSSYKIGKVIDSFSGENRFLGNFAACRIVYNGVEFNSVENAYQAQKCPERAEEFVNISAKAAKDLARDVTIREDWDEVKDTIMRELVTQKFTENKLYREKLLRTYCSTLVEGNYWHDNYWGSCTCEKCGDVGHNKLGKILMEVREQLFKEEYNNLYSNIERKADEDTSDYTIDIDAEIKEKNEEYDSTESTMSHKRKVRKYMAHCVSILDERGEHHDDSKLRSPEKEYFDEFTPQLKHTTYGSKEYQECLDGLKVALDHHYAVNSHHPEHYKNGVNDMDLLELVELICDWKASSERHSDGDIYRSLELNKERFGISEQLYSILKNTVSRVFYGNARLN